MSEITDWIKNDLYPSLFERIDSAFRELHFTRNSTGWISNHYLKGSPHKSRKDKTIISRKAPGFILEHGGETLSLVDYTMRRDNVEFIEAVKTLAAVAGLHLPQSQNYDSPNYQKYREQTTLLEACNGYFMYCLEKATGAEEVRAYLSSRGYSSEDVKAMELGYIPSQEKLSSYLRDKGYSQSLIEETVKLNSAIGDTHKLILPFRSGGVLKGFVARALSPEQKSKYINSTGLVRSETLYNIKAAKNDKDIVIVEGYLDALISDVRGIENVVALGGVNLSSEQVKDALERGAKKFTLCLDKDTAGESGTLKAIEVILAAGVSNIYIAMLPELNGVKADPDQLIKEKGAESFKAVIEDAVAYYQYILQTILHKYGKIQEKSGGLSAKEIDNFLEEVVVTGSKLEPIHRDLYRNSALTHEGIIELGITAESLSIKLEELATTREKEAQKRKLNKLLSEAKELNIKGETAEALELIESKVKEVKAATGEGLLPPTMSFANLLAEIATIPPAYKTGYSSLDKFVGFTPGAITLIGGRPSHGKTTLMFNLLLQMSDLYEHEKFYFFTFEEPLKNLSVKLLNCLIGVSLSGYFPDYGDLSKPTNYEFLKAYIKDKRTDLGEVEEGKKKLQELVDSQRITVIDRNYSVEELASLIAYLNKNKREKIGGVFIDYIQRMKTERKTQDKRTEIAHISDQVLQIAKESGLPIILGAQLNRATTGNRNNKPTLENLKEAGNLEEDANTVLSVYNESREKEETEGGETYKGMREVDLEIKALKNREGEVNRSTILTFDKWTGLIKEKEIESDFFTGAPGISFTPAPPKKATSKKKEAQAPPGVVYRLCPVCDKDYKPGMMIRIYKPEEAACSTCGSELVYTSL